MQNGGERCGEGFFTPARLSEGAAGHRSSETPHGVAWGKKERENRGRNGEAAKRTVTHGRQQQLSTVRLKSDAARHVCGGAAADGVGGWLVRGRTRGRRAGERPQGHGGSEERDGLEGLADLRTG